MRLIEAEALYKILAHDWDTMDSEQFEKAVFRRLITAPTIGGWIPCSERLPEVGHIVLITAKSTLSDDFYVMWANVGKILNNGSLLDGVRFYTEQYGEINEQHGFKVIAWQPLPEPYKEQTERSE